MAARKSKVRTKVEQNLIKKGVSKKKAEEIAKKFERRARKPK